MKKTISLLLVIAFLICVLPAMPQTAEAADTYPAYVSSFIDYIGPLASADMKATGVLASLTIAQAIIESDYGRSVLATEANNIFGMRRGSSTGKVYNYENRTLYSSYQDAINMLGATYINNNQSAFWRAYDSWSDSVDDHSYLINNGASYAVLRNLTDYKVACQLIVETPYTSDYGYAESLLDVIERYKLYDYDEMPTVSSVSLNKSSLSIKAGTSETLTAQILPAGAAGNSKTWTSSNNGVATVSSSGLVSGIAAGTAVISVKVGGKTATCSVTVTAASQTRTGIALDNLYVRKEPNTTSGNYGKILKDTIMTIIGDKVGNYYYVTGKMESGSTGTGYVTAEYVKITTSVAVTSVTLSKTTLSLDIGAISTISGTVNPSNATGYTASWSSSNNAVATVSSGTITAKSTGTATITFSAGGKSATCVVTVTAEQTKTGTALDNLYVRKEANTTSGNYGKFLKGAALTIHGNKVGDYYLASGKMESGANGKGYVTAAYVKLDAQVINVNSVSLSSSSKALNEGDKFTLTGTINPSNATGYTVSWKSSDTSVATVSNGSVTAVSGGVATITFTAGGKSATCIVTVTAIRAAVAADNLYVRSSANASSPTIGKFLKDTPLIISGDKVGIYYYATGVMESGLIGSGYITAEYVKFNEELVDLKLSSPYRYDTKYIKNVVEKTKISDFVKNFNSAVTVKDSAGKAVSGDAYICTGYSVSVNSLTVQIAVKYDINGDGKVSAIDMVQIKAHLIKNNLSGVFVTAGISSNGTKIMASDYMLLKRYILRQ